MSEDIKKNQPYEDLVSVIIPTFNCADFIGITLDSVIAQTYQNWEIIIVDDGSTDNTCDVVNSYIAKESRIKYYKMNKNSGAALARNKAVELARGKYIAFLDSDDVWFPNKLTKQINFMKENNYLFTCTSYTKIDEQGKFLNKVVKVNDKSDYNGILKRNPGNSTVIYNADKLGKFLIPDIRKRNDYVMWLQVIKKARTLYGITEPLSSHRIRSGSLSRNKFSLVQYHWKVYRDIEKLSIIKSCNLVIYWIFITIFRLK